MGLLFVNCTVGNVSAAGGPHISRTWLAVAAGGGSQAWRGPLAHQAEHLSCKQEASGSSPEWSTAVPCVQCR
jgi:hypothetical protein